MMSNTVKNILLKHLDVFLEEVGVLADLGEFVVSDATSSHMCDAVEVVWNAMGYASELQAEEMLKFEPPISDLI